MEIVFSKNAQKELDKMDSDLRKMFIKHSEKMLENPPKRHLRFGLPFNVENITKQARLIFSQESEKIFILHCFKTHKEYEKWYNSFR